MDGTFYKRKIKIIIWKKSGLFGYLTQFIFGMPYVKGQGHTTNRIDSFIICSVCIAHGEIYLRNLPQQAVLRPISCMVPGGLIF